MILDCFFGMILANIFFGIEKATSTRLCHCYNISKKEMQDFQTHGESRKLGSICSSNNAYKTVSKDFFKDPSFQLHLI